MDWVLHGMWMSYSRRVDSGQVDYAAGVSAVCRVLQWVSLVVSHPVYLKGIHSNWIVYHRYSRYPTRELAETETENELRHEEDEGEDEDVMIARLLCVLWIDESVDVWSDVIPSDRMVSLTECCHWQWRAGYRSEVKGGLHTYATTRFVTTCFYIFMIW